jgi:hypothetical protein
VSATTDESEARTVAALAARRRTTQAALGRVNDSITRLRREKTPISVAAIARHADVSRTFLYTNPDAKTAVAEASRNMVSNANSLAPNAATPTRPAGANAPSIPSTHSKPPTPRSSPSAPASENSSAASGTLKPNGPKTRFSESLPRTPHSNSASVS